MSRKVQVLGRSGRNSLQKSTTFNVSAKRQSQFQKFGNLPTVPGPVATDPYYNYNTLLIHADGVSGANNTVFLDNSGSTYIPFSGTYSNWFNGTSGYLQFPKAAGLLTTGQCTIEAWVNITAHKTTNKIIANQYWSTGQNGGWGLEVNSSGNLVFAASEQVFNTFPNILTSTSTLSAGRWYHVAIVRDSSNYLNMYIDGILAATPVLYSADLSRNTGGTQTSWLTNIGINNADGTNYNFFNGYVSNARIVNGTAIYTSNFTPPITPLTAVSGTQLLTCQSSTFVDNSTNNYTVTQSGTPAISSGGNALVPTGRPIQGTFTPFSQNVFSSYFSTATDYMKLNVGGNANYSALASPGTGNFTIECWVFLLSRTANSPGFITKDGRAGTNYPDYSIGINSSGYMYWYGGLSTGASGYNQTITATGSTVPLNQWVHLAFVRNNMVWSFYANGVYTGGGTQTQASTPTNNYFWFFTQEAQGATDQGNFYLSTLRIVIGEALYTGSFIPPSPSSITVTSNTQLLAFKDNRWVDNSLNKYTFTPTGTPSIQAFSPAIPSDAYTTTSTGGSIYFNGSTDYIIGATNNNLSLTSNFTIEFWVYGLSTRGTYPIILGKNVAYTASAAPYICYRHLNSTNTISLHRNSGTPSGSPFFASSITVSDNVWYHVALVRNGSGSNNCTMFINGVNAGSYTDTTTYDYSFPVIGSNPLDGGATVAQLAYGGYISNLKITNGKAIYLANFTPPTSPSTTSDAPILLLNATDSGIVDQTGKNNLTTYGSAAISTTQSKFGRTSLYFDGSTSYITSQSISSNIIGTSDFTIECWIYPTNVNAAQAIVDIRSPDTAGAGFDFYFNASGKLSCSTALTGYITGTATISNNTWTHIALVRNSTSLKTYVNGIQDGSTTNSANFTNSIVRIGGVLNGYFTGYIDDLRITRYARYTSNFTPPTAAFPDQ